jgi:hypothetical protein
VAEFCAPELCAPWRISVIKWINPIIFYISPDSLEFGLSFDIEKIKSVMSLPKIIWQKHNKIEKFKILDYFG